MFFEILRVLNGEFPMLIRTWFPKLTSKYVFLCILDALSVTKTQITEDMSEDHRADADNMYVFEGDSISE